MALLPTKQRDQVLFMVCLLSLAGLALYYQYVWTKKAADLDTQQERVEALETMNARAKRDMARGSVTKLKNEAERLGRELEIMRQLVPTTNEVPGGTSQPSHVANCGRSGIDTAPGTCPPEKSDTGRTSTTTAPLSRRRSTAGTESAASRPADATSRTSGPRRLSSPSRKK